MGSSMTPVQFFYMQQLYCTRLGAKNTAYYRPPESEDQQTNPIKHSPHPVWLATDVTYLHPVPEAERVEWGRWLFIKVIPEADHDHLQPLDWEAG